LNTKITLNGNGGINLREGFERFIQEKRAMNLSEDTIFYYNLCFRYLTDFLDENTPCHEINSNMVIDYILHMKEKTNRSDSSINTYLRGVRAIFYNLMEKGYITPFKIRLIKAEKKIKETYTDYELEKLLKKPDMKTETFATYRAWVIVCYLLGTGNRLRTLCNIKNGDIDFTIHEIKLKKVKNKKQYTIPLSRTLEKVLLEYMGYRKGEPDDYLFCTSYGQQLSQEALGSAIYRYNQSRGVTKTSIHLFRHPYVKHKLKIRENFLYRPLAKVLHLPVHLNLVSGVDAHPINQLVRECCC